MNRNEMIALLTSKSGVSSISISSDDEKKGNREERPKERKSISCCDPGWVEPISRFSSGLSTCVGLEASDTSRLTNASSSSLACNPSSQKTTIDLDAIKPSMTAQGKLVARVLPSEYGDYDTQKSMARIDPAPLIRILSTWQGVSTEAGTFTSSFKTDDDKLQTVAAPPSRDDTTPVVALDLYIMRTEFLQGRKNHSYLSCLNCDDVQDDLVHTLMNSVDLSRNNSSHVGFERKSNDTSLQDDVFHLHMNRSSQETAARTLRRLEVSTMRKLKEMYACHKKKNNEYNMSLLCPCQSFSRLTDVGSKSIDTAEQSDGVVDELGDEEDDVDGCRSHTNLSEMNSVSFWYKCAARIDRNLKVELILPSDIVPFSTPAQPPSHLEKVQFDIISNPPTLLSIQTFENFTSHLFTGVPIVLRSTIIYATHAVITWFANDEVVARDSNIYTPSVHDVGKRISVLVTPIRTSHNGKGYQEAYAFTQLVELLPTLPIVELRQSWILSKDNPTPSGMGRLRVLTYNILADLYAGRDIDQQFMYSHCDSRHLLRKRRMPMIIAEILVYDADIICLQEVDASIHDTLLRPVLSACGYQGYYSNKVTAQQEGCSMFWSLRTFELACDNDMMEFPLRELLSCGDLSGLDNSNMVHNTTKYYDTKSDLSDIELERWESMHGINILLGSHQGLRKVYQESIGQIVQVARLSPKRVEGDSLPGSIAVANTHLFYHPMADHIRLLQAYAICHKLDEIRRGPVLVCGDFNSGPLSGVVRLLTNRSISPNENDCWKHLNAYTWECGNSEYMLEHGYIGNTPERLANEDPPFLQEEFVDAYSDAACLEDSYFSDEDHTACPPTIVLPSCFPTLVSGCLKVPAFTNYAVDFIETLDFVFASEPSAKETYGFRPLGEAPMPTEDMVKSLVAMPNELMPSDHVAIVCDFEWTTNDYGRVQNQLSSSFVLQG